MNSVFLLISFVHLVLAFSSRCTSATTTPNQVLEVVRDNNGDVLKSGARYFVVSAIRGAGGGGVRRGPVINGGGDANIVCPSQVVQSPSDLDRGMPVVFKPKKAKKVQITESTDLNIEFYLDNPTEICNNTVWEVEGFPGNPPPLSLSTNGKAGNPLQVASWFQIKKVQNFAYKLVFCPYGERFLCTDVGIDFTGEQRVLAIGTGNTFRVMFIKDPYIGINSII